MIELLHAVLRGSHILVGAIGLGLFWGAACSRKGSHLHRQLGRFFHRTVSFVVVTSLVSCCWNLIDPVSFTGNPTLTNDNLLALRFNASLLACLAMMTWSAAELGVRCVRMKSTTGHLLDWKLQLLFVMLGLTGAGLLAVGVIDGNATNWRPRYWLSVALGLSAMLSAVGDHAFARNPNTQPVDRLVKHIGCMIGCGIAYHTAVTLAGARRFLDGVIPENLMFIAWILPSVIGWPWSVVLIRRYASQFPEKDGKASMEL